MYFQGIIYLKGITTIYMPKKKKAKKKATKKARKKTRKTSRPKNSNFESWLEERSEEFGRDMERIGEHVNKKMERKMKKEVYWSGGPGPLGPLFGSIVGIVLVSLGIWIINGFNVSFSNNLISSIAAFLYNNLAWIFLIFMFSGYKEYMANRFYKTYWIISPIMSGISAVIIFWILAWVIGLTGLYTGTLFLTYVSNVINNNLNWIFFFVGFIGYIREMLSLGRNRSLC